MVARGTNMSVEAPENTKAEQAEADYSDLKAPLDVLMRSTATLLQLAEQINDEESVADLGDVRGAARRVDQLIESKTPEATREAEPEQTAPRRVRHEIRNGLNQIIGLSELIAESELLGAERLAATPMGLMRRSANRLLRLVEERLGDQDPRQPKPEATSMRRENAALAEPERAPGSSRTGAPDPESTHTDDLPTPPPPPVDEDITQEDLAEPAPMVDNRGAEPGDVLIIDDDKVNRELLGRWVGQLGHRAHLARGGVEGLEMVSTGGYDLVLLDVLMPDMNGYEFLGHIKANRETADLPVIMVSGLDEIDSVARCIELGAEDYLAKPFNTTLLRARIQACLEKKRLRDEATMHFERLRRDLAAARALQTSMLPANMPVASLEQPVSAHAFMEAARDLSGDFYDVFPVSADEIGFVVGDGAKKGVAAALFMARAMSLIRMSTSKWNDSVRPVRSPADTLTEVNAALAQGNVELIYATMFMGVLDMSTGFLQFCNAGHVPPFLVDGAGAVRALDVPSSLPLGMGETAFYEDRQVRLEPGETVFVFTDGLTDALNRESQPYSTEQLKTDLALLADGSVEQVIDGIRTRVSHFIDGMPRGDDMTALCLRWDGPAAA